MNAMTQMKTDVVSTEMNFISKDATSPAVVYGTDGQPPSFTGGYEWHAVNVENGRTDKEGFELDRNGFELVKLPALDIDFDDDEAVRTHYYPVVEATVKAATGGSEVLIFDHTVRKTNATNGRFPASHVHVDYTEESALPRLLRSYPHLKERAEAGRFQQVNIWRSTNGVIRRSPLAFADVQGVNAEDLVETQIRYQDKDTKGVIYGVRRNEAHRWVYFAEMDEQEAVLIKGYDTVKTSSRFTPHSAFELPNTPDDAPARGSIETRTFVFHD